MLEENEEKPVSDTSIAQSNATPGYFIPYGAVYDNNGKFADKGTDGTFTDVNSNYKYRQFKLPREVKDIDKLTPFGAATQLDAYTPTNTPSHENFEGSTGKGSWRFGSYSEYDDFSDSENPEISTDQTNMHHGTMMFVGDWLSLKEYYVKQGNTVQQFVKAIYKEMTELESTIDPETQKPVLGTNVVDEFTTYHVSYQVPDRFTGEKIWVDVYKYPRKHYIWRDFGATYDNDGNLTAYGKLEYAIRLHNMQPNRTYTAVAYCLGEDAEENLLPTDKVQISHNVKSIHLNSAYQLGGDSENRDIITNNDFSQGTIDSGKIITGNPLRLYTTNSYAINDYKAIIIPTGYEAYLHFYTSADATDSNWKSGKNPNWRAGTVTLTGSDSDKPADATHFKVVLRKASEDDKATISTSTIPDDAIVLIKNNNQS
jgi:hypothetical protein